MPPDGGSLEELRDAIAGAFTPDELKQTVRFKLGKDLDAIVNGAKPFNTVVFDLLTLSEREGWFPALVQAVATVRRDNPAVVAACEKAQPGSSTPTNTGDLVGEVKAGVEGLVEAVRGPDPRVRQVIGRFQSDFENGSQKFELLKKYKALHDRLHTLQFQYFRQVADAVGPSGAGPARFRADEARFLILQSSVTRLRSEVEQARAEADGLPNKVAEEDWLDDYDRAVTFLDVALNGPADGPAWQAVGILRGVLAQQAPRINNTLATHAGELPLGPLVAAMRELAGALGPAAGGKFAAGLDALQKLQPRLAGLVEEHYEWQWLDKEFAAADALPGSTPAEKFPRWPKVRDRLRKLCDLARDKPWAAQLAPLPDVLEATADPVQFNRAFNKFRDLAAERFYRVDVELRDLSEQLVGIARPLNDLLEVLTDDGT